MICGVKCGCGLWVKLPSGVDGVKNNTYDCPATCKRLQGLCKGKKSFKATAVWNVDENHALVKTMLSYDSDAPSAETPPISQPVNSVQNTIPPVNNISSCNQNNVNNIFEQPNGSTNYGFKGYLNDNSDQVQNSNQPQQGNQSTQGTSKSDTVNKYLGLGKSTSSGQAKSEDDFVVPVESPDEVRIGKDVYRDCYIWGGVVYTNNIAIQDRISGWNLLDNALWDIFYNWNTEAVFVDRNVRELKLREAFIWLIANTVKTVKKSDVDKIIREKIDGGVDKVFFYLFYDVIFKRTPPRGFYYRDSEKENRIGGRLMALFSDKDNFINRYCDSSVMGQYFRKFYSEHKEEVLYYLNIESEIKLLEDITKVQAKLRRVVFVSRNHDYPLDLGTIDQFISAMQVPTSSEKMGEMIEFLDHYYISSNKEILVRDKYVQPFEEPDLQSRPYEDDRVYKALGIYQLESSVCATSYLRFICLLREYVSVFKPNEVRLGRFRFTKSNFSSEIKAIICDSCKILFGEATSETEKDEAIGSAWLVKGLYERNVMAGYVCEDRDRIDCFMKLVEEAAPKSNASAEQEMENAMKRYFELCDIPIVRINGRDITVGDHIASVLTKDVRTACKEIENDKRINAYLKSKTNRRVEDLTAVYNKLQEQYDRFTI